MEVIEILKKLNFKSSKNEDVLISDTKYPIQIYLNNKDIKKSKIDFGSQIKVWHKGTSNLKQAENFVVLECILRLLKKGYLPENIELEKTWKSGHGTSGRLDILLRSRDKKTFAMIECKTWGEEYAKERNNMTEDGGQLFSYYVQERNVNLLILYSSNFQKEIEYIAQAVETTKVEGNNNVELYNSWDKSFTLENKSEFFTLENGVLYNKAKTEILH